MQSDPIVEEVLKIRDAYAQKLNYDLDAICRDLQEKQKRGKRKVVLCRPNVREKGVTVVRVSQRL